MANAFTDKHKVIESPAMLGEMLDEAGVLRPAEIERIVGDVDHFPLTVREFETHLGVSNEVNQKAELSRRSKWSADHDGQPWSKDAEALDRMQAEFPEGGWSEKRPRKGRGRNTDPKSGEPSR